MIALALAALIAAQTSGGGWAYTSWGMTPEQAQEASAGALHRIDASGEEGRRGLELLEGSYDAANFRFNARLGFHGGRLTGVYLTAQGENVCGNLQYRLEDLYGETEGRVGDRGRLAWRDEEDNTRVQFSMLGGSGAAAQCLLIYSAIRSPANEGL